MLQGAEGIIEKVFLQAVFMNVKAEIVDSPLVLPSAKECIQFEKESFGALHQMMSSLSATEKESVWEEIEKELQKFEKENTFVGPCEKLVAVGEKP